MKTAVAAVLCLLVIALPACAVNPIDGKWEAHFPDVQGKSLAVIFDLNTTGNTVAGTVSNWDGSRQLGKVYVQNGKVQGTTVTFGIFYPLPFLFNRYGLREMFGLLKNWGAPVNTVSGTVVNDTIAFTQRDWKGDTIQLQAIRMK